MYQHEDDGRELEELRELDVDLQDRQRDRRLEQEIFVCHTGHGDEQIGYDGEENELAGL